MPSRRSMDAARLPGNGKRVSHSQLICSRQQRAALRRINSRYMRNGTTMKSSCESSPPSTTTTTTTTTVSPQIDQTHTPAADSCSRLRHLPEENRNAVSENNDVTPQECEMKTFNNNCDDADICDNTTSITNNSSYCMCGQSALCEDEEDELDNVNEYVLFEVICNICRERVANLPVLQIDDDDLFSYHFER